MKKLLFSLLLIALSFTAAQAQIDEVIGAKSSLLAMKSARPHANGLDTAGASPVSQILQLSGYNDVVTIQTSVTKLTGTPTTGGSVKLYGSIDGTIYDLATVSTDTLAVGNVTPAQIHTWTITPSKYQYYKLIFKPSGTQTSKITSGALIRNK